MAPTPPFNYSAGTMASLHVLAEKFSRAVKGTIKWIINKNSCKEQTAQGTHRIKTRQQHHTTILTLECDFEAFCCPNLERLNLCYYS